VYVTLRDTAVSEQRTRSARQRVATTVILLGIVSLFTDISSEMVNSVLPQYLTFQVGLSLVAYGFIDGLYQGVSAAMRIAGGAAADWGHRPKWVAVVGYGVSALSRIAMLPAQAFAAISAVVTVDRLGKGIRTAPRDALITDASAPESLGRSFGVHRMLDTFGAAIGPVIAFAVLWAVPESYRSVFVVSFAFAIIGLAVLLLFVPDRRTGGSGRRIRLRELGRQITAPVLRRPMAAAAVLGLFTVGDGFLYLALAERDGLAALWFPLLYVGTNTAYLLLAIPFGRLADRVGRVRVFLGGHVALLLVYLVAGGPLGGLAGTLLALALLGTYYASTDGVLAAIAGGLSSEQTRGTGIAATQTVVAVARFIASLLFGSVWMLVGRSDALLLAGLALLLAIGASGWLLWPSLRARTVGA
jgi:MFS family permease